MWPLLSLGFDPETFGILVLLWLGFLGGAALLAKSHRNRPLPKSGADDS